MIGTQTINKAVTFYVLRLEFCLKYWNKNKTKNVSNNLIRWLIPPIQFMNEMELC